MILPGAANLDDRTWKRRWAHALGIDRREQSSFHLALCMLNPTSFLVGCGENLKRYKKKGLWLFTFDMTCISWNNLSVWHISACTAYVAGLKVLADGFFVALCQQIFFGRWDFFSGDCCLIPTWFFLQDLLEKPKYLLTFTVGVGQKAAINAAVQKVSHWTFVAKFTWYVFGSIWLGCHESVCECLVRFCAWTDKFVKKHFDQLFGLLCSDYLLTHFAPQPLAEFLLQEVDDVMLLPFVTYKLAVIPFMISLCFTHFLVDLKWIELDGRFRTKE